MTTKLSIITINRNNAEGLRKTMESVLMQTFADFEYIVVDGTLLPPKWGVSTDYDVIESFIKETHDTKNGFTHCSWLSPFGRVEGGFYCEPDTGVYNAMNKGILKARGEYLLFLNSGDFLVNERVLENICSCQLTADVLCGSCRISENGKVIHTTNPPDFVTFGTLYLTGLAHQATFIKRILFESLGLYDESFKYNADIEFWYRSIILGGASTQKIDVIISDYNLDGISSKQNQTDDFKKEHERILAHPTLKRIVPDFEKIKKEKADMSILYWIKSKNILYAPLKILYQTATFINGKKK